jgi:orotate phosphoribosyltransferase-like protein
MEEDVSRSMEDVTELDLMKEFMRLADKPLQEYELTVNMYKDYMNVSRNKARHLLYKYEQMGLLKKRKVTINGSAMNAYTPAEGSWQELIDKMKD